MIYAMALGRTGVTKEICGREQKKRRKKEGRKEIVGTNTIKKHDPELFDGFAR